MRFVSGTKKPSPGRRDNSKELIEMNCSCVVSLQVRQTFRDRYRKQLNTTCKNRHLKRNTHIEIRGHQNLVVVTVHQPSSQSLGFYGHVSCPYPGVVLVDFLAVL